MVPLYSVKISRVPTYSKTNMLSTYTGLSPTLVWLSIHFYFLHIGHWADPRSLATTSGISVDFFSSGYWDVSLPRVSFIILCIQIIIPFTQISAEQTEICSVRYLKGGFPHSDIYGSKSIASPRNLSQRITSFIASDCQGIHQMPFKTLEFKSRAGINPLQILAGTAKIRFLNFL